MIFVEQDKVIEPKVDLSALGSFFEFWSIIFDELFGPEIQDEDLFVD